MASLPWAPVQKRHSRPPHATAAGLGCAGGLDAVVHGRHCIYQVGGQSSVAPSGSEREDRMGRLLAVLAAGTVGLMASAASAQNYAWKPDKPVTIIVPWAAGGSTDQM